MYNHNKAQQSKNRVHISWDILYLYWFSGFKQNHGWQNIVPVAQCAVPIALVALLDLWEIRNILIYEFVSYIEQPGR